METTEQLYYVIHVYRGWDKKNRMVAEDLTLEDAQGLVAKDMEENPKAEEYMLSYKKQLN